MATWPRQRRLRLEVTWRGGAESYWLISARGRSATFTGHDSLEDVMAAICNEWNGAVLLGGHRGTPAGWTMPDDQAAAVEDPHQD